MAVVEVVICNRSCCHNPVEDRSYRLCEACRARGRDNWRRNRQRTSYPCPDCGQERENRKFSRCFACRDKWLESRTPPPPPTCDDCGVEVSSAGRCQTCKDERVRQSLGAEFGLVVHFSPGDDPPTKLRKCLEASREAGLDISYTWPWALTESLHGVRFRDTWRTVLADTSQEWFDSFHNEGPRLVFPRGLVDESHDPRQGRWQVFR